MNGKPPRRSAGHGWSWMVDALKTVCQWPAVFLPMGLIVAVIQLIPLLGGLVLLVAGPALVAGSIVAAHAASRGMTPVISQLFALFEEPTRRKEALKLCLPLLAGKFLALIVLAVALTRQLLTSGTDMQSLEGHPEKVLALLGQADMMPWLAAALAIVLLAWTFTAMAIPRVALGHEPAFDAIRHGLRQVWASIGAWIIAALLLFAIILVVTSVLMLTKMMLVMQLGVYTALYAILGPLLYAAWRDISGATSTSAPKTDHSPRNAPPPSGVLEA